MPTPDKTSLDTYIILRSFTKVMFVDFFNIFNTLYIRNQAFIPPLDPKREAILHLLNLPPHLIHPLAPPWLPWLPRRGGRWGASRGPAHGGPARNGERWSSSSAFSVLPVFLYVFVCAVFFVFWLGGLFIGFSTVLPLEVQRNSPKKLRTPHGWAAEMLYQLLLEWFPIASWVA